MELLNAVDRAEHSEELLLTNLATCSWRIIVVTNTHLAEHELHEVFTALLAAILALVLDVGCLAMSLIDVDETAHWLPGGEELVGLAFGTDELIEKFSGIGFVDVKTRAMIPIITATIAPNHHAVVIGTSTDAVLLAIVALRIGCGGGLDSRLLRASADIGFSGFFVLV